MEGDIAYDGYRPGSLGQVIALHADYYSKACGLGVSFETLVANGLAAFLGSFVPERDLFLCAYRGDEVLGSISVDGQPHEGAAARIRWFIMSDNARGKGIGKILLHRALDFADGKKYTPLTLLTFASFETARGMYTRRGFVLTNPDVGDPWGQSITTQEFTRVLLAQ